MDKPQKIISSSTKEYLLTQVKKEIEELLSRTHKPSITKDIDAVWVFSGPGTLADPLKPEDATWMKWMDRYRIIYGVSLIKEITKIRVNKDSKDLSPSDIENFGSYFIYNGTKEENEAFKNIFYTSLSIIPKEKIIIIENFLDENRVEEIQNTLDQIKSFSQEKLDKQIIKRKIALVSHAQHFPRILRYIEKYKPFPEEIDIEIFSLKPPAMYSKDYTDEEAEKVLEYFLKGDLSFIPAKTEE